MAQIHLSPSPFMLIVSGIQLILVMSSFIVTKTILVYSNTFTVNDCYP